ncbi:uncharacterized protein B0T23DRAFT_414176 [Neurospora hispaniola]|uniref:Uncharacterized protein n=1 Tax=Neurospora hispaniola TaxID=588809 RepID=A0AAJ0I456_9PEZI|nr:hypothetical protein B0T23DRAFT_414176 [Neurospora hispaniola]
MAQGGDVSITNQLDNVRKSLLPSSFGYRSRRSACKHRVTGLGSAVRLQEHTLNPGRIMVWSHAPLVLVKRIGKSRCVLAVAFPVRLVQPRFALGEETREVNSSLGKLGCDEHDQSSNILSDMSSLSKTEDFKRFEQAQTSTRCEGDVKETLPKASLFKAVAYRVLESSQLPKRVPSVAAMEVASPDNVCDKGGHRQCAQTLPCGFRNKAARIREPLQKPR